MSKKTTVIIPSRNERFLAHTVQDVLKKAAGDIEVIAVCEGYWPGTQAKWPNPPLPEDKRVHILHHGSPQGMRPAINHAVRIAHGDYFMKLDGHCMVEEGFDEVLKADIEDNWIVVPRRYALDPENWAIENNSKYPVDAHYLSFPYERLDDPNCGLHGTIWKERGNARKHILIDDEMSSQGSCWFMSKKHWQTLGEMEVHNYGSFIQEFQEIGMKTWLGGGEVKVNKKTWYAHLHKGAKYGRGYVWSSAAQLRGRDFAIEHWMHDCWQERKHDLSWLIERFWPVPGWPINWQEITRQQRGRTRP